VKIYRDNNTQETQRKLLESTPITETTATRITSHNNQHHGLIIYTVELSSSALAVVVQICVV